MFLLSLLFAATMAAPRLSVEEARALQVKGEAVLIDVRGSVPYELGHIEGAVWMPLGLIRDRGLELPQDKVVVAYCTCNREETSLEAADALHKLGFERVAVLTGGYPAWVAAGLPVAKSEDMAVVPGGEARGARRGRIAPPAGVACNRNNLTLYAGTVTSYKRTDKETKLTIRTDWDTTEKVVVKHGKAKDPVRYFLIGGSPMMGAGEWSRFEEKRGRLRKGMRAHVWVCNGGATFVDWRPGESGSAGL